MKVANDVISAIRALGQVFPEDIQAITAALSCKVAADPNAHLSLHQAAIDVLDNLSNYLVDSIEGATA